MRPVDPKVYLIGETEQAFSYIGEAPDLDDYLKDIGVEKSVLGAGANSDSEVLVEAAGRLCYRAFEPGLNPNVTKIREGNDVYLGNILKQHHGSVLEHASVSFIFQDVSRVFTHELVRHRAGCAISQESMRYVRLDDIPFWFPEWAKADVELYNRSQMLISAMERHQLWMAEHFKLDEPGVSFEEKKHKTSFMRRFAPDGVATAIMWTANFRTLRHVLELRTSKGAEEEIRMVFNKVGEILSDRYQSIFQDFTVNADGEWIPENSKV